MIRRAALALLLLVPLLAQEPIDNEVNRGIRQEAAGNSQVMRTVHAFTDVFGPRLTGSPHVRAAAEWAAWQLSEWGLSNAHIETWDFGRPGWSNARSVALLTAPVEETLVAKALAWTPATEGAVRAPCAWIIPPDAPTAQELAAWLDTQRETITGRIVLVGRHLADAANPPAAPAVPAGTLTASQVSTQVGRYLRDNGAVGRLIDAARPVGQLYGFTNNDYDVSRAVPTLIIRNEDYGRITRLMADGIPVEMELQIDSRTHPDGRIMPNVIAEIPGSGKPGELVMLGAHIDSWHLATGATDNAGSAAVMMEAVRILRAIGVQPRRTIRIALWTGEEQGLLGSRAYVQDHFGSFESGARIEFSRLSAYFNVDYGSGRITGLNVFGPPEAAAVLSDILRPFSDDGFQGASPITSRRLVNSDYSSFNAAGLPGISAIQDPRDYLTNTLHTNLDTYERVSEADLRQAAMVIASAVYHLAMRDELLPRFPAGRMPPPNSAAIP